MIQRTLCPVCRKPAEELTVGKLCVFPFCSDRCRKIDFFRWWDGRQAIVEELNPDLMELDDPPSASEDSVAE